MSKFPLISGSSSVSKSCTIALTLQDFHSAENNRCARERAFFDESTRVTSFIEKASHKAAEAGAGPEPISKMRRGRGAFFTNGFKAFASKAICM